MVAVWNQKVNPWGPTGGNPMVLMTWQGREAWSWYKYPKDTPQVTGLMPASNYQDAWDSMYYYYTQDPDGPKHPTFDMVGQGLTLGNPLVPGFTHNDARSGFTFQAEVPTFPWTPISP